MASAPLEVNTAFSPEQATNMIVALAQELKMMRIEPDLQLYSGQSQACEHSFAASREHSNHDNSWTALSNSLANQTAAYFLEDNSTVQFPNPRADKHVFGKVHSSDYLSAKDVHYLDVLSARVMEMCFKHLNEADFMERLRQIREFWDHLSSFIGDEKPTIGGNIDIDESMYCPNAAQPGRLLTIQQKGVKKYEEDENNPE